MTFDQATGFVKQFHQIEGPAAKASEHYGAMVKAEAKLKDTVSRPYLISLFDPLQPRHEDQ